MIIRLYMDEDAMDRVLVQALRARNVDVITALDAGMIERDDAERQQRGRGAEGLGESPLAPLLPCSSAGFPYAPAVLFGRGADASHPQVGGE